MNDYLIRLRDQENDERSKGRHFQICFDIDTNEYFLKDLGCGFGTFLRVGKEIVLHNNALINIGDSYIVVTFTSTDQEECKANLKTDPKSSIMLNLKVFNQNEKSELMYSSNYLGVSHLLRRLSE
jgi:hypothetical protein